MVLISLFFELNLNRIQFVKRAFIIGNLDSQLKKLEIKLIKNLVKE